MLKAFYGFFLVYCGDSFNFNLNTMSKAEDLLNAIANNPELREAITTTTTAEEAVKIAADAGIEISQEDLVTAFKSRMSELSEEELQAVGGGKGGSCVVKAGGKDLTVNVTAFLF